MQYLKLWLSFQEIISPLSDDEVGRLFRLMFRYAETGELPQDFEGNERFVWPAAKQYIDAAEIKSEILRQNATRGCRFKNDTETNESKPKQTEANGSKSKQTEANESKPKQTEANESKSEQTEASESKLKQTEANESKSKQTGADESKQKQTEANESLKVKVNDKVKVNNKENILFERFWKAYPRHEAKQNAFTAFAKINPDEALLNVMLSSVARWKVTPQWTENGGQFIPHPATWLNQRRWEDEIPAARPPKQVSINPAQSYSQRSYASDKTETERVNEFYSGLAERLKGGKAV